MAQLRVNFRNNAAAYSVVTGEYHGFMSFPRKKCGPDMLDALVDGRVNWAIFDYGEYYEKQYTYQRAAGRHTVTTLQFWR